MIKNKKTIIITGASSGLGAALAIKYSENNPNLFLIARSEERLKLISTKCKNNGANVQIIIADVTNKEAMKQAISKITSEFNINIVIACAGVSAGTLNGPETTIQTETIFNTNINGVLNTILPLIPHMIKNNSGSIAIISSMAGLIGLSSAPSYSASKGAVRILGQGLQSYLKQYNVHVSTVIAGYIKTPMTDKNNFPMPFIISAEVAANKIIKGIQQKSSIIAFPLVTFLLLKLINLLPNALVSYINSKLPGKPDFTKID